jgi:3',5'-cyclic-AMP phosphodiesterase
MKKLTILKTLLVVVTITVSGILYGQKYHEITFGICSDVHLNLMHDAGERLTTFLDAMDSRNPDFIIELGDFVPADNKYSYFFDLWNSFDGDTYHVIGNHEPDGGFTKEQVLQYRGMENSYYSFEKNGFRFIVLDCNEKKSPDDKPYFNFIGPEQVTWLKNELSVSDKPVVIFSHQALFSPKGEQNMGIDNTDEIQKILEIHNKINPGKPVIACFNGHTHYDVAEKINRIWYITINSMSYNWLGGDYVHVRYSEDIDEKFPYIKFTAPYKDPLYSVVTISTKGTIRIKGKESEWIGPSPWELGYPDKLRKYIRPKISERSLKFKKIKTSN